jgi:hypothetical protein
MVWNSENNCDERNKERFPGVSLSSLQYGASRNVEKLSTPRYRRRLPARRGRPQKPRDLVVTG